MGNDGLQASNNTNSYFAQDAASYSLTYYQNDYKPIDLLNRWSNMQDRFIAGMSGSNVLADRHDLFNGNISAMVSTIQPPATANTGPLPQATAYKYDQLNRLITAQAWQNLDVNNNEWESNGNNNNMYLNTFTYDANGNITSQIRNDNSGNTIDELSYHYPQINNKTVKNRLRHVTDPVNTNSYNDDIDSQSADNYLYTEIGELKSDAQEEIDEIVWTASGKIKEINRIVNSSKKNLKFDYDAMGNRVAKHTYNSSNQWEKSAYYVRDAQGNVISVYEHIIDNQSQNASFAQTEKHIFGSQRGGIEKTFAEMIGAPAVSTTQSSRTLRNKQYELSNHLGNVLVVISDCKLPLDTDNDNTVDGYSADIVSAQDYSPFGVILDNRNWSSSDYRFGFNGKEDDKELIDWQDYGERMYMKRLGRFPSPDPLTKKYPMLTPYQFASNTPIQAVDLDGLEAFYVHGTWSNPATFSKLTVSTVNQIMGNTTGKEFKWSGNNTDRARRKAARDLANHIMKNRDPNQPLTIVGHSHGGNVSIMAANILKKRGIQVDNIVTINTPVREYQLDQGAAEKHVNIYQHYDPVQGGGGNTINIPDGANVVPMPAGAPLLIPTFDGSVKGTGEMGPAGRTFGNAINIDVPFDKNNVHNTHNTPNLWQGDLNNAINPPPMQPLDFKPPQVEPAKQDNTYVAPRR